MKRPKVTVEELVWLKNNWSNYSIDELSYMLQASENVVQQWASRLRKHGVDLPKKARRRSSVFKKAAKKKLNTFEAAAIHDVTGFTPKGRLNPEPHPEETAYEPINDSTRGHFSLPRKWFIGKKN